MTSAKFLVLGCGLQGRAVLEDLHRRGWGEKTTVVEVNTAPLEAWLRRIGADNVAVRQADLSQPEALGSLLGEGFDVAIDMLPVTFCRTAAEAAIDRDVHLVNTNYAHQIRDLDESARRAGVTIMGEAGFDPGIDLVAGAVAKERFDVIETLFSYAGGMPSPEIRNCNPISYKVSWSFATVLYTYRRPGRLLIEGREAAVEGPDIFRRPWAREIDFGEFGAIEGFVNGDAIPFLDLMEIRSTVRNTGRWALRWPGHLAFWEKVSALGLLDDTVDPNVGVSPRECLRRVLEPQLQYSETERDMTLLRVDVVGRKDGVLRARRWEMVDYRDLQSGLMSMNRTVGFPASIIAQMILEGTITRRGVCTPARDVPPKAFFEALGERGITVRETEVDPAEVIR